MQPENLYTVRVTIDYMKKLQTMTFCMGESTITEVFGVVSLDVSSEFKISLKKSELVQMLKDTLIPSDDKTEAVEAIRAGKRFDFVPKQARNMDWAVGAVRIVRLEVDAKLKDVFANIIDAHAAVFYKTTYTQIGKLATDIEILESQNPVDFTERGLRLYTLTRKRKMLDQLLQFKQFTHVVEHVPGHWEYVDFSQEQIDG